MRVVKARMKHPLPLLGLVRFSSYYASGIAQGRTFTTAASWLMILSRVWLSLGVAKMLKAAKTFSHYTWLW